MKIVLSKGRVADNFLDLLYKDNRPAIGRELRIINNGIEILIARSSDIGDILDGNYADLGVLGSDVINEKYKDKYIELLDLKTGKCFFALAGFSNSNLDNLEVIATKYPETAKRYLEELKIKCEIIKKFGSLELYPNIGMCDGIIDIVESGKTLEANNLVVLRKFEEVSTRIITTKEKQNNKELKLLINKLR